MAYFGVLTEYLLRFEYLLSNLQGYQIVGLKALLFGFYDQQIQWLSK